MELFSSVTGFGQISPLWPNFISLWAICWMAYLVYGKLLYQLWHFYATGQIVIAVNGQRLNSNIAPSGHIAFLLQERLKYFLLWPNYTCASDMTRFW